MTNLIDKQLGPYQVGERLDQGGMAKRQRQAWDVLRRVETRLVADFLT